MQNILSIQNLSAKIGDKIILEDISFDVGQGQVVAIMGKNGSGKSTLSQILMGNPTFDISGKLIFQDIDISTMSTDERARLGLFLAFQYPVEIPGVNYFEFLRLSYNSIHSAEKLNVFKFRQLMREELKKLDMSEHFMNRNLNEGFSGGEKKKAEILQMFILKPKFVILDETDSGLDRDSLKTIFENLKRYREENPKTTFIIISHYPRVFEYLVPDMVHIIQNGKVKNSGTRLLIEEIEKKGYENLE